jgi:hypothetical protein
VPLVLFPLLGIFDVQQTAAPFANPLIFLFLAPGEARARDPTTRHRCRNRRAECSVEALICRNI